MTPFRVVAAVLCFAGAGLAQQGDGPISLSSAKALKSPIPYTKKSITQGRAVYARMCVGCHGADGKATVDVVADATDLTDPKAWKNGISEGEIYRSIRDGQGASMPAFRTQIKQQDDLWHLVNFIRSLWPESSRPSIVEDSK